MKIYYPSNTKPDRHIMFVAPGAEVKTSEFLDEFKKPIMFTVTFEHGVAKVPSNLGKFMVDRGMARRSELLLPEKPGIIVAGVN